MADCVGAAEAVLPAGNASVVSHVCAGLACEAVGDAVALRASDGTHVASKIGVEVEPDCALAALAGIRIH